MFTFGEAKEPVLRFYPGVKSVFILGTTYTIEVHKISEDSFMDSNDLEGYTSADARMIVMADLSEKKYFENLTVNEAQHRWKETLRHEIVHAFLNESGLGPCALGSDGPWSKNEEMIDWFAIQGPKIMKAWKECECL